MDDIIYLWKVWLGKSFEKSNSVLSLNTVDKKT